MESRTEDTDNLGARTIRDFGNQWSRYIDNEGWYGSVDLLEDILGPTLDPACLESTVTAEIGSGTGRIVKMLLDLGVDHVYAIEPSEEAYLTLQRNTRAVAPHRVTAINATGDSWNVDKELDYVFAVGVIHHIPKPEPVLRTAFKALKPGGHLFLWVYGYEGNEIYLSVARPIRKITAQLPHVILRALVELLYYPALIYCILTSCFSLPLRSYFQRVFRWLPPAKRRLVIYDQLNPTYTKYYKKQEVFRLLSNAGFGNIRLHHRHGYSWSALGQKPCE